MKTSRSNIRTNLWFISIILLISSYTAFCMNINVDKIFTKTVSKQDLMLESVSIGLENLESYSNGFTGNYLSIDLNTKEMKGSYICSNIFLKDGCSSNHLLPEFPSFNLHLNDIYIINRDLNMISSVILKYTDRSNNSIIRGFIIPRGKNNKHLSDSDSFHISLSEEDIFELLSVLEGKIQTNTYNKIALFFTTFLEEAKKLS